MKRSAKQPATLRERLRETIAGRNQKRTAIDVRALKKGQKCFNHLLRFATRRDRDASLVSPPSGLLPPLP